MEKVLQKVSCHFSAVFFGFTTPQITQVANFVNIHSGGSFGRGAIYRPITAV